MVNAWLASGSGVVLVSLWKVRHHVAMGGCSLPVRTVSSLCLTLWLPCDTVQVDDVPTTVFFTRFYMELSRLQHESRQAMLTLTGGGSALQPGTFRQLCQVFIVSSFLPALPHWVHLYMHREPN